MISSPTRSLSTAAVVLLLLTCVGSASAEPWARPDKMTRVSASAFTSFAGEQFSIGGERFELLNDRAEGSVQWFGTLLEADIVVLPRLTLFWDVVYQAVTLESPFSKVTVSGLGDFALGGRWQIASGSFHVSTSLQGKFPTGYTADPGPFMPTLGNGVAELEGLVHVGRRFDLPILFAAHTGYRLRGTRTSRGGGLPVRYADQVPYYVEAGGRPLENLQVVAVVDGVFSLGPTQPLDNIEFHPPAESYLRVGPAATYRLSKNLFLRGTFMTTLAGNDTFRLQHIALAFEGRYLL